MSRENREQTSARTANRSISSLRICSSCGDRASAAVPGGGEELIDPLRVPLYKATMHTLAHILLLDVPRVTTTHFLGPPRQHDSQGAFASPAYANPRVTRNPLSKTSAWYPVSCRVPRIFTTRS